MKSGVIVLGGHIQGLNIIRIFGQNSIPSILLDRERFNLAKHSKYCKAFYHCRDKEYLEMLLDFIDKNLYKKWLIFPTNDEQVEMLSKNRDRLNSHFIVTTDRWLAIEKCYNKVESYKLAQSLNIPIATTIFPQSKDDLIAKRDIRYPCIIKPAIMHKFYSKFKKKVFVCNNKEELLNNYELALQAISPSEIIVQEIIEGNSQNQYSVGLFFANKRVYNYIIARRKRQHPKDFGNATTFAESVEIEILKERAIKLLEAIDYNGLCEVEFKYDIRDNEYKFLEINPRTWKWHSISQKANVPFLLSIYNYLTDSKPLVTDGFEKSYFKHILLDTIMILMHKEYRDNQTYEKDRVQYAVWSKDDIKPAFFELLYFPYNIFKR